jgi:ribosomal protein S10
MHNNIYFNFSGEDCDMGTVSNPNKKNSVTFKLKDDILVVCNNGEPFSIEGIESLMLPYYTPKSEREYKQTFKSKIINEQVEELIEIRRTEYIDSPWRIQSDYNNEYNTVGAYHGREILELIQNCIDAMPGDNTIQIGAKGLGFRSLLNWCDRIEIYSGKLSVAFGMEETARFSERLGLKQKVAILSAPTIIEPIVLDYTTKIVLHLKNSVIKNDVKAQLMKIDERSIVFLPKIEELIIRIDNSERSYQKPDDSNCNVLVSAMVDGVLSKNLWRVFKSERKTVVLNDHRDNKKKEYSYEISVAFCDDIEDLGDNYLYSYFETKVELPIGWLCHADFELSPDRNTIIEHPLNELILKEMVALIDDSSEKITKYIRNPEKALKSIVPSASMPKNIAGVEFRDYYFAKIGRKKVLPTTNGEFISIGDSPLLANGDFPALFKGDAFKRLLRLNSDNEKIIEFVKNIAAQDDVTVQITALEIQTAINSASKGWSPDDCLTVFEWWRNAYGTNASASDCFPNLIRLENGNWATGKDKVYFKVGRVPDVPEEWVKFNFMSEEFQKATFNFYGRDESYLAYKKQQAEQRSERNISDYAAIRNKTFFGYLDRSTAISQVNTSVDDNWDHACEFLAWLYRNYGSDEKWKPPTEVSYNFPSQNKSVVRPENLYFGEYYGNELAAILAMQDEQDELFNLPLSIEEKTQFVEFMNKFGVRFVPVQEQISLNAWEDTWKTKKSYIDVLLSDYYINYPLQLDRDTIFSNETEMRKEGELLTLILCSYKNLDDILNNAKTSDLFLWIERDDFLKNSLISEHEKNSSSLLKARREGQYREGRSVPYRRIRNYIAHTFTYANWIQIGEKRYSPRQIILDEKIGTQLEPYLIGKNRDSVFTGLSVEKYVIDAIIENLGFVNDFSKIESSVLYTLLNELSADDVDKNGELSKKIYLQIMKAPDLKDPDLGSQERKSFLQNGKIYCFDRQFHSVQEVRYADKSFPDRIRANHYLIHLQKSRGAIKAKLWFGVEEFKPDVTVGNFVESVEYNKEFQEDFYQLLKGLYVENLQIRDGKRWRSVRSMKIILASQVTLSYGKDEQPCEIYEYAKYETGKYVLMIGNESPDKFNERLTSVLFEIFKTVIDIEDHASVLENSFRDLWKYPGDKLRDALIQRNDDENIWQEADWFFDGVATTVPESDIISENRKQFEKCRIDHIEKFKRILYAKLFAESPEEQKSYSTEINRYNCIEPPEDSLQESPCNVFSLLLSIAPADLLMENDNNIDVEAIGKETKQKLWDTFPQHKNELNGFLIGEYDSLLRFGNFDFLKNRFIEHLEKMKADENAGDSSAVSPKRPIVIDSSKYRLSPTRFNQRKSNGPHYGRNSYIDYSLRQTQNAISGKEAEKIVYEQLVREHGESAVKWVSQFAKEENVNLDGSDNAHYDIEYYKSGTRYFVEVKNNSGFSPIFSFKLTNEERSFAIKNENYQVFVVTARKSDAPNINTFSWDEIKAFANTPAGYLVEFELHDR